MKRPLITVAVFVLLFALVFAGFFFLCKDKTGGMTAAGNEAVLIDLATEFIRINWTEEGKETFVSLSENSADFETSTRPAVPVIKVDSLEKLKAFLQTADTVGGAGEFASKCAAMDEEFFKTRTLFVSYLSEGSGSVTHSASAAFYTGDKSELRFVFARHVPEIGTCDMAAYLSYTVIENSLIEGCDKYSAFLDGEEEHDCQESTVSEVQTMESSSEYVYCGNTVTKIKSIAGGVSSGSNYITIDAEFWGEDSVWLTDTLRKLDYSGSMCKCMAEYSVETEFGSFSVNLSQKYARNGNGQSDIDDATASKIKTIITKYGDNVISEPVVVRVKLLEDDSFTTVSINDCQKVSAMVAKEAWDDGVPDCIADVVVQVGKNNYYYHVSCGTFIDAKRSLPLTEKEKEIMNAILADYLSFDGAMPVSSAK